MPVPAIGTLSIYISPSSINVNSINITVDGSSDTFNSSISGEYLLLVTHGDYNWNDTHIISVSCDGYLTASGTTNTDGKVYITLQQAMFVSKLSNGGNTYIIKDSEARTALANKQDTLVSGTNIKTINSTSLLGSGNISIVGLPSQTSQSGKVLTTDGTTASWQKQYAMVIVDYTA